jgi:ribosomal protein S18 acetylase RimI-like enzyme
MEFFAETFVKNRKQSGFTSLILSEYMIIYTQALNEITAERLEGFFVGWPNPPSKQSHMKILRGSYCFWVAMDKAKNKVIGFITAISDGVISAYIPLLEVLPEYQNRGIGKELVSHMQASLKDLYMVDLLCDAELQDFYQKLGMKNATGSFLRRYERQNCD